MNNMTYFTNRCLRAVFPVVAGVLLASCEGETSNLPDPIVGPVTKCSTLANTTCIPGRFIVDAVQDLDYECGKVRSRTELDGFFSCPKDSEATFSLIQPDVPLSEAKRITLGSVTIRRPAAICVVRPPTENDEGEDCSGRPPMYVYVTPIDLAPNNALAQNNITRLLQTLSTDNNTTIPLNSPARRVVLSQDDKEKLSGLSQSIVANDFSKPASTTLPGDPAYPDVLSFDEIVQPFLTMLPAGRNTLISSSAADVALTRGVASTLAGMYVTPNLFSVCSGGDDCNDAGLTGSTGTTAADSRLIGAIWSLVDRKRRTVGGGVYSQGVASLPLNSFSDPKPMALLPGSFEQSHGVPLWPRTGNLNGLSVQLHDLVGNEPGPATNKQLILTQGRMERGAVAGTATIYRNLFGDNPDASASPLGQWKLVDSISPSNNICPVGSGAGSAPCIENSVHKTTYTLIHNPAVATTLDPAFWHNFQGLASSPTIKFPLNIKAVFKNSKLDGSGNLTSASRESLGTVYFTILADGNIVTNLNYDPSAATKNCNADLDLDTLQEPGGFQEYSMGTVMSITETLGTDFPPKTVFMTPLFILPDAYAIHGAKLPGIQAGSNIERSFAIRIGAGSGFSSHADFLKSHSVIRLRNGDSISGGTCANEKGCVSLTPDTAEWINQWRTLRASWSSSNEPSPTNPGPITKQLVYDSLGIVETGPVAGCLY